MLPSVCPGRWTTRTSVPKSMESPSSSLLRTGTGLPMSALDIGRASLPRIMFCTGLGAGVVPSMTSASRVCAATAIDLPLTNPLSPPQWSGWAWVTTTRSMWLAERPRALSPRTMRPVLPSEPASTSRIASPPARTVTRAPIARTWNKPSAIRIGLRKVTGIALKVRASPGRGGRVARGQALWKKKTFGSQREWAPGATDRRIQSLPRRPNHSRRFTTRVGRAFLVSGDPPGTASCLTGPGCMGRPFPVVSSAWRRRGKR